jgi:hypothetical protein
MARNVRFVVASLLGPGLVTFAFACVGDDPALTPVAADGGPGEDGALVVDGGADALSPTDSANGPDASTFCTTKVKSAGVADFLCADFDEGAIDKGWSLLSRTDSGVLDLTTAIFASPPKGLSAEAQTNDPSTRGGWLTWTAGGANKIKNVTIDVKINPNVDANGSPPQTGYVELAAVGFQDGNVSIRYTDGRGINGVAYTGYYLYGLYNGGGSIEQHMPLPSAPTRNAWTTLRLFVTFPTTGGNGIASVMYNGVKIGSDLVVPTQIATSIDVSVGAKAVGVMSRSTPHRFDDVIVEVVRE